MLEEGRKYTISELAQILKESASESKPKIDSKVIKDDAKNNVKAVNDIMKQTSDYNKVKSPKRNTNPEQIQDFNKTTLDVNFAYEPSKEYKERVKSLVDGFSSPENEKNSKIKDENKSLNFQGNEDFYKNNKEKNKKLNDKEVEMKHSGLTARNLPKDTFKNKTPFTENRKMKRLHFGNTVFLNEEHMLKKIPEDYKVDGNKFYMRDKEGTEYLIECKTHPLVDYVYTEVVGYNSPKKLDENLQRIKELAGYKSSDYNAGSTTQKRLDEDKKFGDLLKTCKKLTEQIEK